MGAADRAGARRRPRRRGRTARPGSASTSRGCRTRRRGSPWRRSGAPASHEPRGARRAARRRDVDRVLARPVRVLEAAQHQRARPPVPRLVLERVDVTDRVVAGGRRAPVARDHRDARRQRVGAADLVVEAGADGRRGDRRAASSAAITPRAAQLVEAVDVLCPLVVRDGWSVRSHAAMSTTARLPRLHHSWSRTSSTNAIEPITTTIATITSPSEPRIRPHAHLQLLRVLALEPGPHPQLATSRSAGTRTAPPRRTS